MQLENFNKNPKEDMEFQKSLLSKHTQLFRMYMQHGNIEMAKEQFEIVERIFNHLNSKGESVYFYTKEDFKQDKESLKYR